MNDRALLELAAKALGPLHCLNPAWNPLDDDGDALRLMVRLSLLRYPSLQSKIFNEQEVHDRRPSEAMRRAIVRCAAEIGAADGVSR